jgi:hypothetical protein
VETVQLLTDIIWNQWRKQYLAILKSKHKWECRKSNIKVNDVILLKDPAEQRINWPVGIIDRVFPNEDRIVRNVVVQTIRTGNPTFCIRPIHDFVLLIDSE